MTLKEFNLEGKVAIVTGAGRGIGRAIALALAEAGAAVAAAARTREEIEDTAREVRRLGRKAIAVPTDVTRAEEVARLVEQTVAELGKIDILVNNAGTDIQKPLAPLPDIKTRLAQLVPGFEQGLTDADWNQVLDTNLTSHFLCCRAVAPHLIQQRSGKVIGVTSMLGVKGSPYELPYCSTKAAVIHFTRALALEWARYNINVNAIAPGYLHTRLSDFFWSDEKFREQGLRSIPLRRLGEPREIGLLAVFLASPAADYITGQTIVIDGGWTLG
jgi:NAD(P)-dependent dehydrogenase (short-subunit alcohol dehydrogenase family)